MTYKYVATCLFGLEHLLGEEIDALGYKRINTIDGRVVFEGDENAAARCNIWLRFAERVFILVGECRAENFDMLFEGTRSLPWENYIGERDEFPVKGHSIKSALFSIPDCQKIVKKAVVERLRSKYGTSWFAEDGVKYQIEFFILKDEAMLMIDTSGAALHKRGYRPGTLEAPLRETLAAALASIARPREDVLFWDPFCGSGTIAIEAAMIMKNIAPGANRAFAGEKFGFFDEQIWKDAREEAKSAVKTTDFEAYAS
ncbi:MAG: class I SAM-dependent RNA methyltransferase, partial [Clostridia bacterium]|nr:class I SAM-dependent RNA methyltransferase [Clostridia bacterium]